MDIQQLKEQYEECESFREKLDLYEENADRIQIINLAEAVKPVVEALAELKVTGNVDNSDIQAYTRMISDISETPYSKTDVGDMVDNFASEMRANLDDRDLPLDTWLEHNVDKIRTVRSSDSHVNTTYVWVFEDRISNIETEEEHYSHDRLGKEIYKQFGVTTLEPSRTANDDWGYWIERFIDDHEVEQEFTGVRTQVIEQLQSRLSDSDAYTDLDIAFKRGRVYYDEDEDSIYIPSDMVASVCDEYSITPKALQVELQNKGYVGEGGCSEKKRVAGKTSRFWELPPDFADVNAIDPEDAKFENSRNVGGEV